MVAIMNTKLKTKLVSAILLIAIVLTIPVSAFAQDGSVSADNAPHLTSISFKNATLDQEFNPSISNYTITLDDPNVAPTLKEYTIDGDADIFITYDLDSAGRQSGIKATLKFSNISIDYKFVYSNPPATQISSNNNLAYVGSNLCEVYPELNKKDTSYTIYIPSDLMEIELSVATEDPNAICKVPGTIKLNDAKEISLPPITVVASDSSTKTYNFKVERLDMTMEQMKENPDSRAVIKAQITHEKAQVLIIVGAVILGLIALVIFTIFAKRLTVKVYDEDEKSFFDMPELEEKSENEEE